MIILFGILLKIPVGFSIWLVYWASREYDELEDEAPGTSEDHGFRRWRREPKPPRDPRRGGPHGGLAMDEPQPRNRVPNRATPARQRATSS
jgi:hypothetical protein